MSTCQGATAPHHCERGNRCDWRPPPTFGLDAADLEALLAGEHTVEHQHRMEPLPDRLAEQLAERLRDAQVEADRAAARRNMSARARRRW